MVCQIEPFRNSVQMEPFGNPERAAEACVDIEEIEPRPRVAIDEHSVDGGAGGRALNRVCSGSNVEWQRRVVLQHRGQTKAVTQVLPRIARLCIGGMNRPVEHQPIGLVIVERP